jgi:hypothetical protein
VAVTLQQLLDHDLVSGVYKKRSPEWTAEQQQVVMKIAHLPLVQDGALSGCQELVHDGTLDWMRTLDSDEFNAQVRPLVCELHHAAPKYIEDATLVLADMVYPALRRVLVASTVSDQRREAHARTIAYLLRARRDTMDPAIYSLYLAMQEMQASIKALQAAASPPPIDAIDAIDDIDAIDYIDDIDAIYDIAVKQRGWWTVCWLLLVLAVFLASNHWNACVAVTQDLIDVVLGGIPGLEPGPDAAPHVGDM